MKRSALSDVNTDNLSAVDSEVMPCTPAHQAFELLLIPGREGDVGRQVMLKQQVPQPRLFVRERQVGVREPGRRVGVCAILQHRAQALVQGIEHPGLDVQHHVVEIVEHIVDGARRVRDAARDLARRQAGKTLGIDDFLRSIENELAQLLGCVR